MAEANGTVKSEEAFTEAENLMKLLLSLDKHEARRLFGRLDSQLIDVVKTWGHSEVLAEGMKHLERAVALRNRMREFIDPAEACHRTMNALVTRLVMNLESCEERPSDVQLSNNNNTLNDTPNSDIPKNNIAENDIPWECPIRQCIISGNTYRRQNFTFCINYKANSDSLIGGRHKRMELYILHRLAERVCIAVFNKTQQTFVRLVAVPINNKDLSVEEFKIELLDADDAQPFAKALARVGFQIVETPSDRT